jgi:NAD-dependent SIR2 family protein deacetylase
MKFFIISMSAWRQLFLFCAFMNISVTSDTSKYRMRATDEPLPAQAFKDDPKLVWSWHNDRQKKILAAKPNAGHIAIANLQNHREVSVITQNIDGLHHFVGSSLRLKRVG